MKVLDEERKSIKPVLVIQMSSLRHSNKSGEDDKEADEILHAENQAGREKHLDLMERNTEASCSIAESFRIMAAKMN